MKKSLLSLLIFALVFTMAAPAFAATDAAVKLSDISNSYAKEEIEALVEAGIIGGYADGTFKPANSITRAEFAKILALVLDLEEDAAAASVFTDVPAWAKGYVGALVNAELTQGVTATTYGSNQNISREQLATFFVRAWDLEEAAEEVDLTPKFNDADKVAPYAKANVALAGEIEFIKGLPNGNFDPKGNAQRQAVARLAYEFYANSEEYLAAAEDVINAAKPTLEVTDVKATNLKEVFVEFNQDVNEGSVADANFTVKDKDGVTVETTATLTEDGKTVVLTVKDTDDVVSLKNQSKYTLTVEKVKSVSDIAVEKTEKEFTAFDRELPEVEKVVVTGPKSFDIIFSEPIKGNDESAGPAVEVKDEKSTIGVNQSFEGFGTRTISVDLYSDMVDGNTYDVTIKNFEDYAAYKNVVTVYELAYEKDETAPVAEVIKAEQEYVVVKFNKPVSGLTPDHFYHSFSAWKAVGIYKKADPKEENAISTSDKVSTVYVYFYEVDEDGKELEANRPLPEGKVTFVTRAKVSSNEVKDNWGNKFEEAVFELNIASDKVTPDVQDITVRSENVIRVAFNKGVNFGNDNVEVLNTDGSKISGVHEVVSPVSGSTSTYDVNFGKDLSGKTVLVKIKDVEDRTLAGNKLSLYTETITITDKTPPSVKEVLVEPGKDNKTGTFHVIYDEAVNSTAIVKANYSFLEGKKLVSFNGTASFNNDNKVVKLVFGEAQWKKYDEGTFTELHVANVEDASGNKLVGQVIDITALDEIGTYAPYITSAEAIATDKLELTFSQFLPTVQMNAFTVNGSEPAALTLSTNGKGNTVATLTAKVKGKHDASDFSYTVDNKKDVNGKKVKNVFGVDLVSNPQGNPGVDDGIAPVIVDGEVYISTDKETIKIYFAEDLKGDSFADYGVNGFSVSGGSLASANLEGGSGNIVVLTAGSTKFSENTRISYNGTNVTDKAGNKLASFNYSKKLKDLKDAPKPVDPVAGAKEDLKKTIDNALLVLAQSEGKEGSEVGNYIEGSRAALRGVYNSANAIYVDTSATEKAVQDADKDLKQALVDFEDSKVTEITVSAKAVEVGTPSKETITLAVGETLEASSTDTTETYLKVTVSGEEVTLTGVSATTADVTVTLTVKNAAGKVTKVGSFDVTVTTP